MFAASFYLLSQSCGMAWECSGLTGHFSGNLSSWSRSRGAWGQWVGCLSHLVMLTSSTQQAIANQSSNQIKYEFLLWGMTYHITCELLSVAKQRNMYKYWTTHSKIMDILMRTAEHVSHQRDRWFASSSHSLTDSTIRSILISIAVVLLLCVLYYCGIA
jgi:hypothetical protein